MIATAATPPCTDELLASFEACTLPGADFHHADHVHVAWAYLQRLPLLEALPRFVTGLQRFAAHHGAPQRYHATITLAYFFLIAERREQRAGADTWEEFAAANADLLQWKGGVLERRYSAEMLASDLARRVFVLPDGGSAAPLAP